MVGHLEHIWYFNCGRCSTPPHLLVRNFTITWYIWPNGHESLSVCVSCSPSVVAYLGGRDNASMPNEVVGQGC